MPFMLQQNVVFQVKQLTRFVLIFLLCDLFLLKMLLILCTFCYFFLQFIIHLLHGTKQQTKIVF